MDLPPSPEPITKLTLNEPTVMRFRFQAIAIAVALCEHVIQDKYPELLTASLMRLIISRVTVQVPITLISNTIPQSSVLPSNRDAPVFIPVTEVVLLILRLKIFMNTVIL